MKEAKIAKVIESVKNGAVAGKVGRVFFRVFSMEEFLSIPKSLLNYDEVYALEENQSVVVMRFKKNFDTISIQKFINKGYATGGIFNASVTPISNKDKMKPFSDAVIESMKSEE